MAVITKYVVVRNGVELDRVFANKKEAESYDRMLDAADNLAAFIKESGPDVGLSAETIESLSVFLAENGPEVSRILKGIKPVAAEGEAAGEQEPEAEAETEAEPEPAPEPAPQQAEKNERGRKRRAAAR